MNSWCGPARPHTHLRLGSLQGRRTLPGTPSSSAAEGSATCLLRRALRKRLSARLICRVMGPSRSAGSRCRATAFCSSLAPSEDLRLYSSTCKRRTRA